MKKALVLILCLIMTWMLIGCSSDKNAGYITVHSSSDHTYYINVDHIVAVYENNGGAGIDTEASAHKVTGYDGTYFVRETPEEVLELISKAK